MSLSVRLPFLCMMAFVSRCHCERSVLEDLSRRLEVDTQTPAEIVVSNTNFALDLYQILRAESGNIFFSPFSITTALGMLLLGARSDTRTEMKKVMGYGDIPRVHRLLRDLRAGLTGPDKEYVLRFANRLFGRDSFPFNQRFIDLSSRYYDAPLDMQDFSRPVAVARYINNWVEQQTNNKIIDLLPVDFVDSRVILVLVNAIYFKGAWASRFKEAVTRPMPFYTTANTQENVPIMYQKSSFPFGFSRSLNCQILELPYNVEASMVIFLPDEVHELDHLESSLTRASVVYNAISSLRNQTVKVYLPKFKLSNMRVDLKPVLQKMGMTKIFGSDADLSRIGGRAGDLSVSKAIHEAFVEVNEEGTEAAAATAIAVAYEAVIMHPVFRADHPFVFMIRERKSGTVLFMGRVTNPVA